MFLPLAFLFFIGSLAGWVLELVYRNQKRKDGKWINPGFCTGPYVPLYGVGLCVLYLLASLEQYNLINNPFWNKAALFAHSFHWFGRYLVQCTTFSFTNVF